MSSPPSNELDILIQDGDALLEGDTGTDEQSANPQGDQIGFVTNSDGEALLDGVEVYVESSFNFTLDGAGSFTGYIIESEVSGQSFVVLPPNFAAGTIAVTSVDDAVASVSYDNFVSQDGNGNAIFAQIETVETGLGDDTVDATLDTTGVTIITNEGEDVIIGGAGDDSIDAGDDEDTIIFGQNDTVLGGAGADEFIIQPTTGGMGVIGVFDPLTNVDNTVIYDPLNPPN